MSVLDFDVDESSDEPNVRQKIVACLPVDVNSKFMPFSPYRCDCVLNSRNTYLF